MPTSLDPQPGEDEFECARCGALVYYELTRCPRCGVNLYGPEDEQDEALDGHLKEYFAPHPGLFARLSAWVQRLFHRTSPAEDLFAASLAQAELYSELLTKVAGDRGAADRLVELERRRQPDASRTTWIQMAIWRWEQDNE